MSLSILCVTKNEPHAHPFLMDMARLAMSIGAQWVPIVDGRDVHSDGYIESILDRALDYCHGSHVLRLDDDERCSPAMVKWLASREWAKAPHWKFPRANIWERVRARGVVSVAGEKIPGPVSEDLWLMLTPHLWRDDQTRLSVKVKAGGRRVIHSGSPHGGGELAPCMILHEKFLVKTAEERRAIVRRYDSIQAGAGTNFLPWSVPEDYYEKVLLAPVGDGTVRDWTDNELRSVSLRQVAA